MADVGSSRNTTSGSPAIAMAKRTRWACPPERRSVRRRSSAPMSARSMICVTRRRPAVEPPDQVESILDANAGWEADTGARLEHGADSAIRHGLAWVAAEHLDAPFLRSNETEQRGDRGRLAGPIRSEKRKDLPLSHLQIQPVKGNPGPVAVGDVLEGQGGWSWPRRCLSAGQYCYKGRQDFLRRLRPRSCCKRAILQAARPPRYSPPWSAGSMNLLRKVNAAPSICRLKRPNGGPDVSRSM